MIEKCPVTARNELSKICLPTNRLVWDRLVGLVVKASASRAGGPGFESR